MIRSWLTDVLPERPPETVLFLRRSEVARCLNDFDPVDVVRASLLAHRSGRTVLPSEAYLPWTSPQGEECRSISMPGAIRGPSDDYVYGMKIINAGVSNPERGIERAGGLGLCFDSRTARIAVVMEVGLLSAVRAAAVTALAVEATGYGAIESLGVVGCGTQARMHLALLLARHPRIRRVMLFDKREDAAQALCAALATRHPDVTFTVGSSVVTTMNTEAVLFLTTATKGYVQPDWIAPGSLIVNVSLGDLADDVLLGADSLYVDDLKLITENPRRPLGRLINEGRIAIASADGEPAVTAAIADLLDARIVPPRPSSGWVIVNPFGIGVLDVALFAAVHTQAVRTGIGQHLQLF